MVEITNNMKAALVAKILKKAHFTFFERSSFGEEHGNLDSSKMMKSCHFFFLFVLYFGGIKKKCIFSSIFSFLLIALTCFS